MFPNFFQPRTTTFMAFHLIKAHDHVRFLFWIVIAYHLTPVHGQQVVLRVPQLVTVTGNLLSFHENSWNFSTVSFIWFFIQNLTFSIRNSLYHFAMKVLYKFYESEHKTESSECLIVLFDWIVIHCIVFLTFWCNWMLYSLTISYYR